MKKFYLLLFFFLSLSLSGKAQFYSASVNLPALLTGTVDSELSMTLNRNWSLHGELSFHPWKIESFRIQHLMFRPQIRWWSSESYRGFFVGGHFLSAGYHIGIPRYMKEKYEGVAFGGGA